MNKRFPFQQAIVQFILAIGLAGPAYADQLVYVALEQPCRLLDTRTSTGGPGPLNAGSPYTFGADDVDIKSAAQHGNSAGCGVPLGIAAISVNVNMLNTTAAGNITTWSVDAGITPPAAGTGVYNPSVTSPTSGQVLYNTGYTTIPVGASNDRFYLNVANGQIDMTINLVGYWRQVSWGEATTGANAVALGYQTTASGGYSTALGQNTLASNYAATAIGYQTQATSNASFAAGQGSVASGYASFAMGFQTHASGSQATALGYQTSASGTGSLASGQNTFAIGAGSFAAGNSVEALGNYSVALGSYSRPNTNGSFIYCDTTCTSNLDIVLNNDNMFVVLASGGVDFITSTSSANPRNGVFLNPGSGSWGSSSDRNGKTAVRPINSRDVLARVVALPMNSWQYKTQNPQYRHMGPMAQDFYAAFHLGETEKGIDAIDSEGVSLAAIQGLNSKLEEGIAEKDREIDELRSELERQNARVATLETVARKVAELESRLGAIHVAASADTAATANR